MKVTKKTVLSSVAFVMFMNSVQGAELAKVQETEPTAGTVKDNNPVPEQPKQNIGLFTNWNGPVASIIRSGINTYNESRVKQSEPNNQSNETVTAVQDESLAATEQQPENEIIEAPAQLQPEVSTESETNKALVEDNRTYFQKGCASFTGMLNAAGKYIGKLKMTNPFSIEYRIEALSALPEAKLKITLIGQDLTDNFKTELKNGFLHIYTSENKQQTTEDFAKKYQELMKTNEAYLRLESVDGPKSGAVEFGKKPEEAEATTEVSEEQDVSDVNAITTVLNEAPEAASENNDTDNSSNTLPPPPTQEQISNPVADHNINTDASTLSVDSNSQAVVKTDAVIDNAVFEETDDSSSSAQQQVVIKDEPQSQETNNTNDAGGAILNETAINTSSTNSDKDEGSNLNMILIFVGLVLFVVLLAVGYMAYSKNSEDSVEL